MRGEELRKKRRRTVKSALLASAALMVGIQGPALAEEPSFVGKWYVDNATECKKRAQDSAELVEYTSREVLGPELRCRIRSVARRGSKTELNLRCDGEGETSTQREVVEVLGNEMVVTHRGGGRVIRDAYKRCEPNPAKNSGPPRMRVGECLETQVQSTSDRFGGPLSNPPSQDGTSVRFENRLGQVSYQFEAAIARSRAGDRVQICLKSLPRDCPPGDERGKVYRTTNLRTGETWVLPDSQHSCGGA
jgi:hypothetical protein